MTTDLIPVVVHSRNNHELPETKGTITRINWQKTDRTKNAVKTFGMFIGFTFASVFVPIAHFILVPSLFITSFVLAMDKLREEHRSAGGSGECPKCHKTFTIEKTKWQERYTDTCQFCHDDLEILTVPTSNPVTV
jgi:hypothetical protein